MCDGQTGKQEENNMSPSAGKKHKKSNKSIASNSRSSVKFNISTSILKYIFKTKQISYLVLKLNKFNTDISTSNKSNDYYHVVVVTKFAYHCCLIMVKFLDYFSKDSFMFLIKMYHILNSSFNPFYLSFMLLPILLYPSTSPHLKKNKSTPFLTQKR